MGRRWWVILVGICLCTVLGIAEPVAAQTASLETLLDSKFGGGTADTYGADLGVGWSRVGIDFNETNYNDIQIINNRAQDIIKLQQKGIIPYVIIDVSKRSQWLTASQYAQAVANVAESFDMDGNNDASGLIYPVDTYELLNEYYSQGSMNYPGLTQSTFVDMFSQGAQKARAASPECRIAYNPFNESDARALLQQIGTDQIDIVSYHTYSPLDYPQDVAATEYFTNFGSMLTCLGLDNKPVWVTEFDCNKHKGMTFIPPNFQPAGDQEDNARWLVQSAVWGLGSDFFQKIFYTEIVPPSSMGNPLLNWISMLDSSGNKRQNYYAYQKLIDMIDNFSSASALSLGDNIYGYSFTKSDGRVVDVLWSKEGTGSKSNVQISGLGSGQVNVTESVPDSGGNFQTTQKTIDNGVLSFATLSEEPVYVELSADQAQPAQLPGAPTIPANLRVLDSSAAAITIAWDASSSSTGIEEYIIEMKAGSGEFVEMGTTDSAACQFTCSDLSLDTGYTFRVRAKEASGSGVVSDWSQELTVSTPSAQVWTEPFAVVNNVAINKSWKIKFSAPVNEGTVKDNIYVATDKSGTPKMTSIVPLLSPDNACQVEIAYPPGGWSKAMAYYIFIDEQLASTSGKKLSEGIRFEFDTAP